MSVTTFNDMVVRHAAKKMALAIKVEILHSEDHRIRRSKSFSELHDYCDANMLGELKAREIEKKYGMPFLMDALRIAQDNVDRWIKNLNK